MREADIDSMLVDVPERPATTHYTRLRSAENASSAYCRFFFSRATLTPRLRRRLRLTKCHIFFSYSSLPQMLGHAARTPSALVAKPVNRDDSSYAATSLAQPIVSRRRHAGSALTFHAQRDAACIWRVDTMRRES